jgi:hypothetical protein
MCVYKTQIDSTNEKQCALHNMHSDVQETIEYYITKDNLQKNYISS